MYIYMYIYDEEGKQLEDFWDISNTVPTQEVYMCGYIYTRAMCMPGFDEEGKQLEDFWDISNTVPTQEVPTFISKCVN